MGLHSTTATNQENLTMGRFEGKQLVKRRTNTNRAGQCTILRGDTKWVVRYKGRHVGEVDTFVEAETLAVAKAYQDATDFQLRHPTLVT